MGFIPIFITMGGACLLFFLTVRTTMQRKLVAHKEYLFNLKSKYPDIGDALNSQNMENIGQLILKSSPDQKLPNKTVELIKGLKVNRVQYNQLIKKAPYNWVAKISGFQRI